MKTGLTGRTRALVGVVCAVALAFIVTGCAGVPERNPLPLDLTRQASIPGVPEARFWADDWPKYLLKRFETYTDADYRSYASGIYNRPHNYLAISGGDAKGAFGAGLLAGWTASGG